MVAASRRRATCASSPHSSGCSACPGRLIDVGFTAEGVVVTVRLRRRRRVCARVRPDRPPAAGPRPARQALAAPRPGRQPLLHRVRAAPAAVPRLRRPAGAGAVGAARRASHARLRGRRRVAGPADGVRADHPAAADRLAHDRPDRHARRRRSPRRAPARRAWSAIGVDEISYRRHHRYLTSVADHATGAIVWCAPGRNSATLQGFFDELGDRKESIRAVSIDMSGEYQRAIRAAVPHAEICFDPFHVVRLGARATDQVRRDEWNGHDRSHTPNGRWVKSTRWSLLKAPGEPDDRPARHAREVQQANRSLYRAFLLREELRLLYHLPDPALAPAHLDAWLAWASRSRLQAVRPARTHAARAPRRHPRRHPPRPLQRPPRRPQLQDPPDQPPRLRLPLRRPPDRPRLPLLRRRHDRPAAMNFTPNRRERRLLRVLRHVPTASADGAPAPHPPRRVRRAPPGRFPRSPSTGRQGRRSAVPRGASAALYRNTPRSLARPISNRTDGDGPERTTGTERPNSP